MNAHVNVTVEKTLNESNDKKKATFTLKLRQK